MTSQTVADMATVNPTVPLNTTRLKQFVELMKPKSQFLSDTSPSPDRGIGESNVVSSKSSSSGEGKQLMINTTKGPSQGNLCYL